MGTFRLTLSSEPDLLTAHTGHPVYVAQHWETDEACRSEMPRVLVTRILGSQEAPPCPEGLRGISTRLRSRGGGTSAGEEAARFWLQKLWLWPAAVPSCRSVGWFLCRGQEGWGQDKECA